MANPTPRRRAFNQIQNTIGPLKNSTNFKNSNTPAATAASIDRISKENDHQRVDGKQLTPAVVPPSVKIDDGDNAVVKKTFRVYEDATAAASAISPPDIDGGTAKKKHDEGVTDTGEKTSSTDDFDLDAPIETCPHVDYKPLSYDLDDLLPPEERLSLLTPHVWNRFLAPSSFTSPFDSENKENIFDDDLYANLDLSLDSSTCGIDGDDDEKDERGSATTNDLGLQKLSLRKE